MMPRTVISAVKDKPRETRRPGAGALWRRIADNWEALEALGANPDLGTVIGRMFLFGELSHTEASAARLYAEIAGRYSRYFGLARETAASPAYERGFGREDEVERHAKNDTMRSYERRAKKARRAWEKVQGCLPPGAAKDVLHDVAVLNREVNKALYPDLRIILAKIAGKFSIAPPAHVADSRQPGVPPSDTERRVRLAIGALARWFTDQKGEIRTFRLLGDQAPDGVRGIEGFGFSRAGAAPLSHSISIGLSGALAAHVDALFLRTAESVGWKERAV